MIGYLKGRVIEKTSQEVWVDVRDVGYRLRVGANVMEKISVGDEVELFVHTHAREDALDLYGFEDRQQLLMFEVMIGVSGVGPKTGLGIVGGARVDQIEKAVREADVGFFTRFSGIGKKGAQRILVDLKGKLPRIKELDLSDDGEAEDVVYQALMQFGFSRAEITSVLKDIDSEMSEEDKIRVGLKKLGR
jgi:Holliday junction DNA helicase RuvA